MTRRVLGAALAITLLGGCGAFRRMAGNDTVSLEKADVKSMSVDIRRQQKTICPRESVQMAVYAEVTLPGDKAPKPFETWAGRSGETNKNDKLEFSEFAFHSEQGTFDQDGWFKPSPNLLLTVGKELELKTVCRRRPDKFSFSTSYKPDYGCIKEGGSGGNGGSEGPSGNPGESGKSGQSGSSSAPGAEGSPGATGTSGGNGTDGAPGPQLVVYAALVKTPFYEHLVALQIDGDQQDFLLVPEGQPVTIHASGGAGGSGGSGGAGGHGGSGGSGNPGGTGGRGGAGGNGGQGGNGGPGGVITLVYDAAHPELRNAVRLDVSGGRPGMAGGGGPAGSGGSGGSGITPTATAGAPSPPTAPMGQTGAGGTSGTSGTQGHAGRSGRATASGGNVKDRFGGRAEMTPL
ncbi:MAG: hypothetical protein JWP97_87 [Labilithrix sp.]|nr:hypothetical protein [Labilithrix sp.]